MLTRIAFALLLATVASADAPSGGATNLERWIGDLGSPKPAVRARAQNSLVAHGEKAVPALVKALDDSRICYEAYTTLLAMGNRAIPGLVECLRTGQPQEDHLYYCPSILFAIGKPALPRLRLASTDEDWIFRERVFVLLEGIEAPELILEPRLRLALQSPDPEVRNAALNEKQLQENRLSGAIGVLLVPILIEMLDDSDPENRRDAAVLLSDCGPPAVAAVPALTRLYDASGDDAATRDTVALALAPAGAATPETLSLLERCLHDENAEVRITAARSAGSIGPRASPLSAALFDALALSERVTYSPIEDALGAITEEAGDSPTIRKALGHANAQVRFGAALLVPREERGAAPVLNVLIEGLSLPDYLDRDLAVKVIDETLSALSLELTPKQYAAMISPLFRIIEADGDEARGDARKLVLRLRPVPAGSVATVATALASPRAEARLTATELLGASGSVAASAEPQLGRLRDDADPAVRLAAVRALVAVTPASRRTGTIAPWLSDPNDDVRAAATEAIGQSAAAPAAFHELVRLLDDSSPYVRASAANSLRRFAPSSVVHLALASHLDDRDYRAGEAIASAIAARGEGAGFLALATASNDSSLAGRAWEAARQLLCTTEDASIVAAVADEFRSGRSMPTERIDVPLADMRLAALREAVAALDGLEPRARVPAMRFLVRLRIPGDAAPVVRPLLAHEDETVRVQGAQLLLLLGEQGWRALADDLAHGSPGTRRAAALGLRPSWGVSPLATMASIAVPALTDALRDSDSEVRRAAAASLGSFDALAATAPAALTARLGDPDRHVRVAAGFALRRISGFSIAELQSALSSSDPAIRLGAAESLGCLYHEAHRALEALRAASHDSDPGVQAAASLALERVGLVVRYAGETGRPKARARTPLVLPAGATTTMRSLDVMLVVDANGMVENSWILRGDAAINDAALALVAQWQFEPAKLDGGAVPIFLRETIEVADGK